MHILRDNKGIVVMGNTVQNLISTNDLFKEYDWYQKTFPELVKSSCDEFFAGNFEINFFGLSQNVNYLLGSESCFVTKVRINPEYDMFFRLTDRAVSIILNKILGQSKSKFNLNKMTELEAKIITSFNGFMFDFLKDKLDTPNPSEIKRTNFEVVHLTFILCDKEHPDLGAGKVIVTLPLSLVTPQIVQSSAPKFTNESFPSSVTFVKVFVGRTKFSVYELKNLEPGDVVVFEDSSVNTLQLNFLDKYMNININPNMDLLIPEINDGGSNMPDNNDNIWDSIEVDMYAEFDSVKISLGELKDIENGLVVDLASLYDNKVTLKVEGKSIASGSLVIVNDRYGVKIDNIIADGQNTPTATAEAEHLGDDYDETQGEAQTEQAPADEAEQPEGEEDFDYSDFELEDENI